MHGNAFEQNTPDIYESAYQFAKENNHITYDQFDRAVLKDIRLFDVPQEIHFHGIEETLDQIIQTLPAIRHIFAKPLIRLRDTHELRPIEAVRVIDNRTLAHVAIHSEIWENVTAEGAIVPRKLLTIENVETYAIYENMVFTHVVDSILQTVARIKTLLKDILHGCGDFQVNLLDRTHHTYYFHAIGKLHLEYAQSQEHQYAVYLRCAEKIRLIERTVRAKLHAPVYLACKRKKRSVTLKKSNAFRAHKDYKQIYLLWKWFDSHHLLAQKDMAESNAAQSKAYGLFCLFMSIFAVGHFHFSFLENELFDFDHFDAKASFKDWFLSLKTVEAKGFRALVFQVKKDRAYTSCLVLSSKKNLPTAVFEEFQKSVKADEYLFASADVYGEKDVVYISLYNIDSFRRIQQILLRAMIYADEKRKECPFCGSALEVGANGFECPVCRGDYRELQCPETKKTFYISAIRKQAFLSEGGDARKRQEFLHDRYAEAQLHFRNITPITEDGMPICPHCGQYHETLF